MTRNRNPQPGRSIRRDLQDRNARLLNVLERMTKAFEALAEFTNADRADVEIILKKFNL